MGTSPLPRSQSVLPMQCSGKGQKQTGFESLCGLGQALPLPEPQFPRAAVTKHHRLGSFSNGDGLSALEARTPKPRCQQGRAPSEASREETVAGLSAPFLASGSSGVPCRGSTPILQSLVIAWHSPCPFMSPSLCACLVMCPNVPFCKDSSQARSGPTLMASS